MIRKKIKFLALVLVAVLVLGIILPACGGNEELSVIFDVNCPSSAVIQNEPDIARVLKGNAVARPNPDPARSGYTFDGWYETANCDGEPYDFSAPVTVNNFTLYAKWTVFVANYSVSFNYDGKGTNSSTTVQSGQTVTPPAVTDLSDFYFDGWYADEGKTSPFVANNPITSNITIYAKWVPAVRLTLDKNYPSAPEATVLKFRNDVNAAAINAALDDNEPDRTEHIFQGWYAESTCVTPYEADTITSNKTIFAKWAADDGIERTVTFNYNYPESPSPFTETVKNNSVIGAKIVTRTGAYEQTGWFTDPDCAEGTRFNTGTTPVTDDLTLYAGWRNVFKLTQEYNYGRGFTSPAPRVTNIENNVLAKPAAIAHSNNGAFKLAGWTLGAVDGEILPDSYFGKTVTENITLYAQWNYENVFEAEFVDFSNFLGAGQSGSANGDDAVIDDNSYTYCDDPSHSDCPNYGFPCDIHGYFGSASNGLAVSYLFISEVVYDDNVERSTKLTFEIYSDRAVTGAELKWSLSAEKMDMSIYSGDTKPAEALEQSGKYTVKVNDVAQNYGCVTMTRVPSTGDLKKAFEEFTIGNIDLNAGKNTIVLITDNNTLMIGTMVSTAPVVDYIKITTYADLYWNPLTNKKATDIPNKRENQPVA